MSRPKRTDEQLVADTFADLPVEKQETLLLVLQSIHRQNMRQRARKPAGETAANQNTLPLREPAAPAMAVCGHGYQDRSLCAICTAQEMTQ